MEDKVDSLIQTSKEEKSTLDKMEGCLCDHISYFRCLAQEVMKTLTKEK